jgi:hypothetical protein
MAESRWLHCSRREGWEQRSCVRFIKISSAVGSEGRVSQDYKEEWRSPELAIFPQDPYCLKTVLGDASESLGAGKKECA